MTNADVPDNNVGDLIDRQAAIDAFYHIRCNLQMMDDTHTADKMMHGLYLAENAVKLLPSAQPNAVPRTAYEQAMYERDIAIKQIAEIGKGLGEKMDDVERIVRCKDCKYVSVEPCKDFEDIYVCNRNYWTRAQGGNMPNDFCSHGERKEE